MTSEKLVWELNTSIRCLPADAQYFGVRDLLWNEATWCQTSRTLFYELERVEEQLAVPFMTMGMLHPQMR